MSASETKESKMRKNKTLYYFVAEAIRPWDVLLQK